MLHNRELGTLKLTSGVRELLHDVIKRILWLANNKLFEHVLEELVDLLFLEEALDLVHVVVLLKFIHLLYTNFL